jgi:endonuclease/exonuclease/phosphatase family metal-dependent hydrolase
MERKHSILCGVILLSLFYLGGCDVLPESANKAADHAETLRIATWNLQALFDGDETGDEYDEYRSGTGWTAEKYAARITSFSAAIGKMTDKGPDILALQEVENGAILEQFGYNWTAFAANPGYGLGVGMVSRIPIMQTKAHSVTCNGETTPRPVLEVWFNYGDAPLVLFICHWKSKLGGDDATESLRRASARMLQRRLQEIRAEYPGTPVVIMGDLNENHDEFYRRSGSGIRALLPDDPAAAALVSMSTLSVGRQSDFLIISSEKPPRSDYFAGNSIALYSPWENELQYNQGGAGSYYYKNEWETIDHFLLNDGLFDQKGWDFNACTVLCKEPFINAAGHPNSYNPRTGNGLSDHLPLLLTLTRSDP